MARAGHRRHIPEPVKEMLVTMSRQMSSKDIAKATNTGRSTVNRILRLYKETGSVVKKPEVMGRPRKLVFESPVRSGYLVPRGSNRDRDRLAFVPKPKIT